MKAATATSAADDACGSSEAAIAATFFMFGMLGNIGYQVLLSAAKDIVGSEVAVGWVLMCSILPSLLLKLLYPLAATYLTPTQLGGAVSAMCCCGLIAASMPTSIALRLTGVILSSAGSGLGEATFLALSASHGARCVSGSGSGTAFAGIASATWFWLLTNVLAVTPAVSLQLLIPLPLLIPLLFAIIPRRVLPRPSVTVEIGERRAPTSQVLSYIAWPYIAPLLVSYTAMYATNQGLVPRLGKSAVQLGRQLYVQYSFVFRCSLFIGRTFGPSLPHPPSLWLVPALQVVAMMFLLRSVIVVAPVGSVVLGGLAMYNGLLGGWGYVCIFMTVSKDEHIPHHCRASSMSLTSLATNLGISVASLMAICIDRVL